MLIKVFANIHIVEDAGMLRIRDSPQHEAHYPNIWHRSLSLHVFSVNCNIYKTPSAAPQRIQYHSAHPHVPQHNSRHLKCSVGYATLKVLVNINNISSSHCDHHLFKHSSGVV